MKLKYFIPSFVVAVAAMFTGCSDDKDPTYFDEIRVSQSVVPLSISGGSTSINLTVIGNWTLSGVYSTTITNGNGDKETIKIPVPTWLKVSGDVTKEPIFDSTGQETGFFNYKGSGSGQITFSADAAEGRSAEFHILCGGKVQHIEVIQGIAQVSNATCAEVLAGPDSKTYRVSGTVTSIVNTTYGNWYLNDGTGEVYIYGTLDAKGATKNFLSLGIEAGDQVTVEGPKTTYNGTVELVDVTVVKIVKSLIKCDSLTVAGKASDTLPLEGGEIVAHLTCKGSGVAVEIPAEAQSWLGVVASTVGTTPTITFRAAANTGGDRNTTVTFKTTDGSKEYTSQATINQKGAIIEGPISDFLAAAVGDTQFRLTGVITELYASDKQGKSFYIADYSGKTLIYRVEGFIEAGAKVGDVVTVVGKRGAYKDSPQMVSGTFEKLQYAVTEVTIADFLTKGDAKDVYYMVSGTVTEIANDTYGNLYISDGTSTVYVYGCYPGWGATGDARKGAIAANGIEVGDKLTVIGPKSTYKDTPQVNGGIFLSVEKAN